MFKLIQKTMTQSLAFLQKVDGTRTKTSWTAREQQKIAKQNTRGHTENTKQSQVHLNAAEAINIHKQKVSYVTLSRCVAFTQG